MKNDPKTVQMVNELKNKIFRPRLQAAMESTICFFENNEKTIVSAAGSGVFVQYKNQYYVVTAAHVFAEYSTKTFVIADGKEITLGGILYNSPMPSTEDRADDKIDISILELNEESSRGLLTTFKPIQENEIELNHQLSDTATYFAVGFPQTKTEKVWNKNEIKSIGYTYQSIPILDYDYGQFGFRKETTIAIMFDGKVTSATDPFPHRAPRMQGMSGSGLWNFRGKDEKRLIGISIERNNTTGHTAVFATKIDVVISMIETEIIKAKK